MLKTIWRSTVLLSFPSSGSPSEDPEGEVVLANTIKKIPGIFCDPGIL